MNLAALEACPECSRLLHRCRGAAQPPSRSGPGPGSDSILPETVLARHLANRHPHLIPPWTQGCGCCAELEATLREAQERGLLGAGAYQAGAEHRALHLLAATEDRLQSTAQF